jgi:hypothetical protein
MECVARVSKHQLCNLLFAGAWEVNKGNDESLRQLTGEDHGP